MNLVIFVVWMDHLLGLLEDVVIEERQKVWEDCPNIEDHRTDLRRRLIHQDHDQLYRWEEGVR